MKQYTTPDQTAKLIELGFEKPKNERWVLDVANESTPSIQNIVKRQDYSIGELLSFLPINRIEFDLLCCVEVTKGDFEAEELIDALFDACVKLKEEGVI